MTEEDALRVLGERYREQAEELAAARRECDELRRDALAIEARHDTLAAMVRRAAGEVTEARLRTGILADLAALLDEEVAA